MKKKSVDPKITAYALGQLTGPEADEVRKLIDENPDLKNQVIDIQLTVSMVTKALKSDAPVSSDNEFRKKNYFFTASRVPIRKTWGFVGATLVVGIAALFYSLRAVRLEDYTKIQDLDEAQIVQGQGRKLPITLNVETRTHGAPPRIDETNSSGNQTAEPNRVARAGAPSARVEIELKEKPSSHQTQDNIKNTDSVRLGGDEEEYIGIVNRDEVRRIIRAAFPPLDMCFLSEREKSAGRVLITWSFGESGKAYDTKIKSSSINNKNIDECVCRVIAGLQYPKAHPGLVVEVTYPISYSSPVSKL